MNIDLKCIYDIHLMKLCIHEVINIQSNSRNQYDVVESLESIDKAMGGSPGDVSEVSVT